MMKPCRWIKCWGDAHSNPHIDHCGVCVPRWGVIAVCPTCNAPDEKIPPSLKLSASRKTGRCVLCRKRFDTSKDTRDALDEIRGSEPVTITLTRDQWRTVASALDSHAYWQLSEDGERSSGHSTSESDDVRECYAIEGLITKAVEGT